MYKGRWDRMHQVLSLLEDSEYTVSELREKILYQGDNLTINLVDCLLRLYFKDSFVNREKDSLLNRKKYRYRLSNLGIEQLTWLNSGGHLRYIEKYNEKYNIVV